MKKIIAFLCFLPSLAIAAVHIQQGDNVTLGSVTASSGTVSGNVNIGSPFSVVPTQSSYYIGAAKWLAGDLTSENVMLGPTNSSSLNGAPSQGNVLIGKNAGVSLTTGGRNVIIGKEAGTQMTTSTEMTAVGFDACSSATGIENTCIGTESGALMTTGLYNTLIGSQAGYGIGSASHVTRVGRDNAITASGDATTGIGSFALPALTTGMSNTAVGHDSGSNLSTGSSNTVVGAGIGFAQPNTNSSIGIGYGTQITASNSAYIGNRTGADQYRLYVASVTADDVVTTSATVVNLTVTGTCTNCGGNTALASTQTWTGQNIWTTPAQSTFTYGVAVGSLTITGSGAGEIDLTEGTAPSGVAGKDIIYGASTGNWPKFNPNNAGEYTMVGSSSVVTVGHYVQFGSSGSIVDGGGSISATAGGSPGQIQYNSASSFAGSTQTFVTVSSITYFSSVTVHTPFTTGSFGTNSTPGLMDIFMGDTGVNDGRLLFTAGSNQSQNQFAMTNNGNMSIKGIFTAVAGATSVGELILGLAANPDRIGTIQSSNNYIDIYNGESVTGRMILRTGSASGRDIVFAPETIVTVRMSSNSVIVNSSMSIVSPTTDPYSLRISTSATQFQVSVSTNGALGLFSRTLAQLATILPNSTGQTYYCGDCVTDSVCISTQTVTASWAGLSTSRATACQ